jgi:hypothetical protein
MGASLSRAAARLRLERRTQNARARAAAITVATTYIQFIRFLAVALELLSSGAQVPAQARASQSNPPALDSLDLPQRSEKKYERW